MFQCNGMFSAIILIVIGQLECRQEVQYFYDNKIMHRKQITIINVAVFFFEDNSNEMNERTKNGLVYVALYGKFLTRQRENFVIRSNIGIDI